MSGWTRGRKENKGGVLASVDLCLSFRTSTPPHRTCTASLHHLPPITPAHRLKRTARPKDDSDGSKRPTTVTKAPKPSLIRSDRKEKGTRPALPLRAAQAGHFGQVRCARTLATGARWCAAHSWRAQRVVEGTARPTTLQERGGRRSRRSGKEGCTKNAEGRKGGLITNDKLP